MKSVLISIQPRWCELIASGKKTVEVRKTKPKLETPFKCDIYETQGKLKWCNKCQDTDCERPYPNCACHEGWGKVIGEFVCDKIDDFYCASIPYRKRNNLGYGYFVDNGVYKVEGWHEGVVFERSGPRIDTMLKNTDLENMCLSAQELFDYIGIGKHLYAWHISDLVIYDKPRDLSEFKTICRNAYCQDYWGDPTWFCKDGYSSCAVTDKEREFPYNEECIYFDCPSVGGESCEYEDYAYCNCNGLKPLTRPPQSWCYVESEDEG